MVFLIIINDQARCPGQAESSSSVRGGVLTSAMGSGLDLTMKGCFAGQLVPSVVDSAGFILMLLSKGVWGDWRISALSRQGLFSWQS